MGFLGKHDYDTCDSRLARNRAQSILKKQFAPEPM